MASRRVSQVVWWTGHRAPRSHPAPSLLRHLIAAADDAGTPVAGTTPAAPRAPGLGPRPPGSSRPIREPARGRRPGSSPARPRPSTAPVPRPAGGSPLCAQWVAVAPAPPALVRPLAPLVRSGTPAPPPARPLGPAEHVPPAGTAGGPAP